jgi:protein arginine kinase activator
MFFMCPVSNNLCLKSKSSNYYTSEGRMLVCEGCPMLQRQKDVSWNYFLKTLFSIFKLDELLSPQEIQTALTAIKDKDQLTAFLGGVSARQRKRKCPKCNFEVQELLESGKIGCPYCYLHFAETIKELENSDNLSKLELAMSVAIKAEQYEDAARLRDKIKSLTTQPTSLGQ